MRGPKPAGSNHAMGVIGRYKCYIPSIRVDHSHGNKQVGILCRRFNEQLGRQGASNHQILFQCFSKESEAITHSFKGKAITIPGLVRQGHIRCVGIVFGPLGARDGPFLLVYVLEGAVNIAQTQMDRRLMPSVLAF